MGLTLTISRGGTPIQIQLKLLQAWQIVTPLETDLYSPTATILYVWVMKNLLTQRTRQRQAHLPAPDDWLPAKNVLH
jgi:hypothetical protein